MQNLNHYLRLPGRARRRRQRGWVYMGCGMKKAIISLILLAFTASAFAATNADLRPDAPERYVVQPGDTLWGIATRFLKDAWRWPELWKMNRSQVRNPHRIYPGDVLVLDRSGGRPTLRIDTVRVGPRIRVEARDTDAIPSIPPSAIEPFLSKPMVIGRDDLQSMPYIMATQEDRVAIGAGNIAYVQGLAQSEATRWQVFRRGDQLIDPDTNELLGYIAIYLGEAQLLRRGDISTVEITKASQEMLRGDRLVPVPAEPPLFAYVPHPPQDKIRGRIIKTYGGIGETGPLGIVVLSKGTRDGLETGNVLAIYRDQRSARYAQRTEPIWGRAGPTGTDKRIPYYPAIDDPRHSRVFESSRGAVREADFAALPPERYGLIMVFRVFERASYALVMSATRPVSEEEIITNP
jgi:hypothetical protein